jgi:tetratricopeptide (TPR) repeat protein
MHDNSGRFALTLLTSSTAAAAASRRIGVTLALVAAPLAAAGCAQHPTSGPNAPLPPPPPAVEKYVEGVKAYRAGDKQQAAAALEYATTVNPKLITARSLLGDLYKERGDYTRAADQYKAVTELDPYTAKNYYKLGVAYHLLQKLPDAVSSYLTAIKLDPKDWESRMNVGLVYLSMGKKDLAVSNLSEATIINPGAGVAFGNLAIALDAQGRYAEAETAYKRALELDANDTASLGNLGKNLMRQNKTDQALVVLKKLAETTESASSRKLYADALVMAKKNDEAIALYDNILKEDGKYYPALNGKGSALIGKYEQGLRLDGRQKAAAVAAWKESLALNPQQPKVQEMLKHWSQ